MESVYAQFGAGRSRDSIFNRRKSSSSSNRSSSDDRSAPQAPMQVPAAPAQQPDYSQSAPPPPPPAAAQPQMPPGAAGPGASPRARQKAAGPGGKAAAGQQAKEEKKTDGIAPEGLITLRVVPLDQKVDVDKVFNLHVWLDNPEMKAFDVVSFGLSFDPRLLEYVDAPGGGRFSNVHDKSEKITSSIPLVRDPSEDPFYMNRVDPESGMIYYRARCADGQAVAKQGFLATMKFRALRPIDQTSLRFVFAEWPEGLAPAEQSDQVWTWPKEMTFVGGKDSKDKGGSGEWKNLLGSDTSSMDGVVSGHITLKGDYEKMIKEEDEKMPKGNTASLLVLDPVISTVKAGQKFKVDIRLANKKEAPFDRIRFDIQYDPQYLKVIDTDEDNWVKRGTNVHDGPYHNRFPFEWMRNNMVRQEDGRIIYECGVFTNPLRVSGALATIHFQALRPIPETQIAFRMPEDVTERDGTVMTRKRLDMLGDTEDPGDGIRGAIVSIIPRRPGEASEQHAESGSDSK